MNSWKEKSLLYKLFFTEIWHLAIISSKKLSNNIINNRNLSLNKKDFIKIIKPELSYIFFADPFSIKDNDNYYIFFEYLNYRNKKGEIHYHKYDKNFKLIQEKVAIRKNFHLSYPYIFTEDNNIYIIPEMNGSKELAINISI